MPDLDALAEGIACTADVVGLADVGIGSDMLALVGSSALPNCTSLPDLAAILPTCFTPDKTAGILGGNLARVAKTCLPA
ncbi:hypothetical protein [Methylobacterium sp. A54F]